MTHEAQTTTSHEIIRRWAEARDGEPAAVAGTASAGEPGVLRIAFRDEAEEPDLKRISWNAFFDKFDEKNLAFFYQEETLDGDRSRFFKLVERN